MCMRLVYAADLHGDIGSYRSLLALAVDTGARAAIVGGDLLPHAITLRTAIQTQRDFIAEQLRPVLEWFRAHHPAIHICLLPGNDDWAAAITDLAALEHDGLVILLDERAVALTPALPLRQEKEKQATIEASGESEPVKGRTGEGVLRCSPLTRSPAHPLTPSAELWLAGFACVPLTPFSIKDYERRDAGPLPPFSFAMAYTSWDGEIQPTDAATIAARPSIAEALATLAQRSDPRRTIYVCHTPPFNTPLDAMPRGRHVGSKALRAFIEQHAPPLTLHGHIHESPEISGRYAVQLGATWSINPGHNPTRFQAVALDTDDLAGTITHTAFGRPPSS
jgi:Icc-related predicted phosphoesterase